MFLFSVDHFQVELGLSEMRVRENGNTFSPPFLFAQGERRTAIVTSYRTSLHFQSQNTTTKKNKDVRLNELAVILHKRKFSKSTSNEKCTHTCWSSQTCFE